MAYRRRNRLRRRNARPIAKRARRYGRGLKGVSSVAFRRPGVGAGGLGSFGTRLGAMGRKRNAARAAVLMRRRARRVGRGGGGEIGFINRRGGKYRGMNFGKLMKLSTQKVLYRFQGVNRMNAQGAPIVDADGGVPDTFKAPGYFKLSNGPNANSFVLFPVHCYDLTTLNNKNSTSNPVAYQLGLDSLTSSFQWSIMPGQDANAGTTDRYTIEKSDNSGLSSSILLQRFIQTDWFDIRMVAYGARQQPTYYDIMVVQFSRDYIQPLGYGVAPSGDAEQVQAYSAFWSGMSKNISYSAILPGQPTAMRGMKVLRKFRFVLQPSLTTEADRTPNMRIVKLFQKHYSLDDYNWGPGVGSVTAAQVDGPDYRIDTNQAANVRDHPIEKARTFLIVRASNTTEVALATESADNTPSYDIVIRKSVRFNSI